MWGKRSPGNIKENASSVACPPTCIMAPSLREGAEDGWG